jgi:hypothetical protein
MGTSRGIQDALFLIAITVALGIQYSSIHTLGITSPLKEDRTDGLTPHIAISCVHDTNNMRLNIIRRTVSAVYIYGKRVLTIPVEASTNALWICHTEL